MSLFVVLPVLAEGSASFIAPEAIGSSNNGMLSDDTPDEQTAARQGGDLGLFLEDDDLDQPVQKIIIPMLDAVGGAALVADGAVTRHSAILTTAATGLNTVLKDDYLLVEGFTVRKAVANAVNVSATITTVELDRPFAVSADPLNVYLLEPTDEWTNWDEEYPYIAEAEQIADDDVAFGRDANYHVFSTEDAIVASGVGDAASGSTVPERLSGSNVGGAVDSSDILVVNVNVTTSTTSKQTVEIVGGKRVELSATFPGTTALGTPPSHAFTGENYAVYWASVRNDTGANITVRSGAHPERVPLVLRETSPTSGEFSLQIALVNVNEKPDANTDLVIPELPVDDRDVVRLIHPDDVARIDVETDPPSITGLSPDHNLRSGEERVEVRATVADGDSGVEAKNIEVKFSIGGVIRQYLPNEAGDADEIGGGFRITQQIDGTDAPDDDGVIYWWVKAKDKAGNVAYSDAQPTKDDAPDECNPTLIDNITNSEDVGGLTTAKCQPFAYHFDETAPDLLRIETGRHWDPSLVTGDSSDKTEYRVSKADDSSILVIFNEHLNTSTVSPNDFDVFDDDDDSTGSNPRDAVAYNVTVRDDSATGDGNPDIAGNDVVDVGEKLGYVFLTVSALDPNARPKVELVDEVSDLAGAAQDGGSQSDGDDRIAPKLTVSFADGTRPVTKDNVDITIKSDEDISDPDVQFHLVGSTTVTPAGLDPVTLQTVDTNGHPGAKLTETSRREFTYRLTPTSDGLYTVYVTATDRAGSNNTGSIGDKTIAVDVDSDTAALLFERDTAAPTMDVDPGEDGSQDEFTIDDPDAFITIDFGAEGSEYDDAVAPNGDRIGDDLDTHGMVSIVSATLDGDDIMSMLSADPDSTKFLFRATGLALGQHDLEVVAVDEAGNQNSSAIEATIEITERKPFKLSLNPGWNLVSVPSNPGDTDVNAVFPADHPANTVLTYDPTVPGGWLTAVRTANGSFEGTLMDITSERAYWVLTNSFESLSVDIPKPRPGEAEFLPTVDLVKGWNLVPIVDVDGNFELNSAEADPYNYFASVTDDVTAIYTYDTVSNTWNVVAGADVEIGRGYWVFSDSAATLVPQ